MRFNIGSSSPPNVKQMTPKQAMFFMPILVAVGVALTIFWGIPIARNAMESKNWPSTEGQVTISDVSEKYDSKDGSITYTAKVAYKYTVTGLPYTGSTVAFGDYGSSDPSHAGGIVNRYPAGKSIKVYYNPSDPKTSVLEPGTGWSSFVGLIVGISFSIIGVIGFFFARKKLHSETTTTTPPLTTIATPSDEASLSPRSSESGAGTPEEREPSQPQSDVPFQQ